MKQLLFIWFSLCCTYVLVGQGLYNFEAIDRKALNIPPSQANSTEDIARFIRLNFNTETEKFRAIHVWVASNIKYDSDSMYAINWSSDPQAKITIALKRRKGVCENYAAIFTDIAIKASLSSFVVNGYTKQLGFINRSGHSWCAVRVDDQWFFCDPTWDAGYPNEVNFFLKAPGEFIQTHIPFDPLWQLLDHPITHDEFKRNIYTKKDAPLFNYADSIKAFTKLSELQQLETSLSRMKQPGLVNDLLKNRISYTQMLISIIYENEDMNLYNSAVADLNKAMSIFNEFVQYRNNQFIPERPDAEINAILLPIGAFLTAAYKKMEKIGTSLENVQYNTGPLKYKLDLLSRRVQEQQDFLTRYFAGDATQRSKLFYK